ncbi:MAG: hypothetical protein JO357_15165 [Hyphomicrobiales bacterium]|nr:hypothetical protein [Hyphomicrobiales bacterium]MBV9752443.1 hypothetical protein [Hyphomicrobiales bacterium]
MIIRRTSSLPVPKRQRSKPGLHLYSLALASLALAVSTSSHAADLPGPQSETLEPSPPTPVQGLVFTATLYGWASGLSGRARTLPPLPAVHIDITFDQVLKNFNGALMGVSEVRSGRFIFFTDLIIAKIAPSKEFGTDIAGTFRGTGVRLDSTTLTGLAAGGYRVIDDPRFFIDGFAGVRGFYVDNVLKLDFLRVPSASYGKSEGWADPAIGARFRFNFADNWYFSTIGFIGGTSTRSDFFWDLFGGIGYAFNDRYSVFAGYRAMKVDYSHGNFLYNVVQQGPVMGLNIRF